MANDGSINLGDVAGSGTPFSLSGTLEPGNLTTGVMTLPAFDLAGAFDDGKVLPAFTLQATGESGNTLTGVKTELTLPAFALAGGTADGATLPAFTLSATAENGARITGSVTLPSFALSGSLEPPLALPAFALAGTLATGNVAVGNVALDAFTLAGTFGHQVEVALPAFELAATMLNGRVGDGALALPAFALSASAHQDNTAEGAVTLGQYTLSATMDGTPVIDGSITLDPFTLAAAAVSGNVATAELTLPLYAADAAMGFSNIGTATITLPAFVLAGGVDNPAGPAAVASDARVAATVVALNTRLKGVSLYEGVEANSFAQFAGMTLAATPDGIVALAGDTDMGAPIDASVTSGISDFALPNLKTVLTAYVGYRADGELLLTLITDEHHEYDYVLEPLQSGDDLHASRVKFGRGVRGRYWQWKLANRNGEAFDLGNLELHVQPLQRGV